MSFPRHLALFKDHLCLLLPTISRHFPPFPAKKMSQALVVSQYGCRSRGPGGVPRAAPRQPGCTVEQTNHEPRSLLARGASQREFRGFHESRLLSSRARKGGATGNRRPDHCARRQVTVSRFTVVRHCSIVRHCSAKNNVWSQSPRAARSLPACPELPGMARLRAAIARPARGGVGGEPVSVPRQPFSAGLAASSAAGQLLLPRAQNEPLLGKGCVPDSVGAKPDSTSAGMESIITEGTCRLRYD